mmetsp:Transcript_16103/g.50619  ORF Transcript_16103/g.50619 Transcript_16103/m.50619 type:complete len:319 (+) Transcript_16103:83-1039(+)
MRTCLGLLGPLLAAWRLACPGAALHYSAVPGQGEADEEDSGESDMTPIVGLRRSEDGLDVADSGGAAPTKARLPERKRQWKDVATAVCISGKHRTFEDEDVQVGFARNFHRRGYQYFISTDARMNMSNVLIAGLVQHITINGTTTDATKMEKCPKGTFMHRQMLPMVSRYVACHRAILRAEQERGIQYQYVIRVRPDHLFSDTFPSAEELLEKLAGGKPVLLLDDHIAVARRSHADAILLRPKQAYSECHTLEDWSRACGRELTHFQEKMAPCCPMRMIVKYGLSAADVSAYEFQNKLFGDCGLALKVKNKGKKCYFR